MLTCMVYGMSVLDIDSRLWKCVRCVWGMCRRYMSRTSSWTSVYLSQIGRSDTARGRYFAHATVGARGRWEGERRINLLALRGGEGTILGNILRHRAHARAGRGRWEQCLRWLEVVTNLRFNGRGLPKDETELILTIIQITKDEPWLCKIWPFHRRCPKYKREEFQTRVFPHKPVRRRPMA